MKRRIILLVAVVVIAAGVATGIAFAVRSSSGFPPPKAHAQLASFVSQWRAALSTGARSDPRRRFPSPARSWLKHQLNDAEILCGCFKLVKIEFLHPLQVAPFVVVETGDEHAFFLRQAVIFDLITKVSRPTRARRDWAYEGLLLEARNSAGVPFLAHTVFIRGTNYGGGGFWAVPSIERLVPHG